MPHATCRDAVHSGVRACGRWEDSAAHRECLSAHGLHTSAGLHSCQETRCDLSGETQPYYACVRDGESQTVYGLAQFGGPSRVTAPSKSS